MKFTVVSVLAIILRISAHRTYVKSVDITGSAFYDEFHFFDSQDPTHGRVTYVDLWTAMDYNLTYSTEDSFLLRADDETYLSPSDPGRMSFRIVSYRQLSNFVAVFDIRHMPEGCGTWPAVWTLGYHWPGEGEIDILEGVNDIMPNTATLHTGSNCSMPPSRDMTGQSVGDNCAAYETANQGCGVRFTEPTSFGPSFNSNGGGWFAVERNANKIKVWFWPRHNDTIPSQVEFGSSHLVIEPEYWGTPDALWSSEMCDISQHFGPHNIVINLTFCGDWAGNQWQSSNCSDFDTCENFVNANPDSFQDAYFDIAALRIYE